jgi:hypothetical protein
MSSVTLTDTARRQKHATRRAAAPPGLSPTLSPSAGLRPWHFFLVGSMLLATITLVLMHGQPVEQMVLAILTVAAAGYAGHNVYRMLLPLVSESAGEDTTMVAGRTRAALERDKGLTLRAIKELEFDRAMGKIAEGDFVMMRDRLRARALRLIAQLDGAAAYRDMIERDLAARLPAESRHTESAAGPIARPACAACGALNETDARFCKMCGRAIEVTASSVR